MSCNVQSIPETRHAVPCSQRGSAADFSCSVARNARQISSPLTNGCPTGVNEPLRWLSLLSHATSPPLPCGSRAMAKDPFARRQSSLERSSPSGLSGVEDESRDGILPVVTGSGMSEPSGIDTPHADKERAAAITLNAHHDRKKVRNVLPSSSGR
jgi:hypothetical protein